MLKLDYLARRNIEIELRTGVEVPGPAVVKLDCSRWVTALRDTKTGELKLYAEDF